jgi:hypothetical protein
MSAKLDIAARFFTPGRAAAFWNLFERIPAILCGEHRLSIIKLCYSVDYEFVIFEIMAACADRRAPWPDNGADPIAAKLVSARKPASVGHRRPIPADD